MCQKQFGSFFGAFVTADQAHLTWTRGQPMLYRSSAKVKRGFCGKCGTPLTYQHPLPSALLTIRNVSNRRSR
jgi:hypothetical protein